MTKVTIRNGVTDFSIDIESDATIADVLNNEVVKSVCGTHGSARIDGAEVENTDAKVPEGAVVEPMSKSNEKG